MMGWLLVTDPQQRNDACVTFNELGTRSFTYILLVQIDS